MGRQLLVLALFLPLFLLTLAFLHVGVCVEGGTILGFPWPAYTQCYGPPIPGDGAVVEPATFQAVGLAVDLVFWNAAAALVVFVYRHRP